MRGQCHSLSGDLHIEYPHWPSYILDLLVAPVVEGKIELVAYLVSHHAADADPARRRQSFKPGGDIDAVAVDILPIIHDVAEIDADAELDPLIRRHLGVAQGHLALCVDRAAYRVDDTGEFDQEAIAGNSDNTTAVLLDHRIDNLAAQHPQPFERTLLIHTHQPRIAHDIGRQNRRQPTLCPLVTHHSAWSKEEASRSLI